MQEEASNVASSPREPDDEPSNKLASTRPLVIKRLLLGRYFSDQLCSLIEDDKVDEACALIQSQRIDLRMPVEEPDEYRRFSDVTIVSKNVKKKMEAALQNATAMGESLGPSRHHSPYAEQHLDRPPLHYAVMCNSLKCVRAFLQMMADANISVNLTLETGDSAIVDAIVRNNTNLLHILQERGVQQGSINGWHRALGWLLTGSKTISTDCLEFVMSKLKPNHFNMQFQGTTVLHLCVLNGHNSAFERILEMKEVSLLQPNEEGITVVDCIFTLRKPALLQLIIEKRGLNDIREYRHNVTKGNLLHHLIVDIPETDLHFDSLLAQFGDFVREEDGKGLTPIVTAALLKKVEVMEKLRAMNSVWDDVALAVVSEPRLLSTCYEDTSVISRLLLWEQEEYDSMVAEEKRDWDERQAAYEKDMEAYNAEMNRREEEESRELEEDEEREELGPPPVMPDPIPPFEIQARLPKHVRFGDNMSIVVCAIRAGNEGMALKLLEHNKEYLDIDCSGHNIIHEAAKYCKSATGFNKIWQLWVQHQAQRETDEFDHDFEEEEQEFSNGGAEPSATSQGAAEDATNLEPEIDKQGDVGGDQVRYPRDENGQNLLHYAATNPCSDIFMSIWEECPEYFWEVNHHGLLPSQIVVQSESGLLIDALIEKKGKIVFSTTDVEEDEDEDIDKMIVPIQPNKQGNTMLMDALLGGMPRKAHMILSFMPQWMFIPTGSGLTPLYVAAMNGDVATTASLVSVLERVQPPKSYDLAGDCVRSFNIALKNNHEEVARKLFHRIFKLNKLGQLKDVLVQCMNNGMDKLLLDALEKGINEINQSVRDDSVFFTGLKGSRCAPVSLYNLKPSLTYGQLGEILGRKVGRDPRNLDVCASGMRIPTYKFVDPAAKEELVKSDFPWMVKYVSRITPKHHLVAVSQLAAAWLEGKQAEVLPTVYKGLTDLFRDQGPFDNLTPLEEYQESCRIGETNRTFETDANFLSDIVKQDYNCIPITFIVRATDVMLTSTEAPGYEKCLEHLAELWRANTRRYTMQDSRRNNVLHTVMRRGYSNILLRITDSMTIEDKNNLMRHENLYGETPLQSVGNRMVQCQPQDFSMSEEESAMMDLHNIANLYSDSQTYSREQEDVILNLLSHRPDNVEDPSWEDGHLAALQAIRHNSPEALRTVISKGAHVGMVVEVDRMPLHEAARQGSEALLKVLAENDHKLDGSDRTIDEHDASGKSAVDIILNDSTNRKSFLVLVNAGAALEAEEKMTMTEWLIKECSETDLDNTYLIGELISTDLGRDDRVRFNKKGLHPFTYALSLECKRCLECFLASQIPRKPWIPGFMRSNDESVKKETRLIIFYPMKKMDPPNADILKMIIKHRPNFSVTLHNMSVFMFATVKRLVECLEVLKWAVVEGYIDGKVANISDMNGKTPVSIAVQENQPELLKILLDIPRININPTDDTWDTPIERAVQMADEDPRCAELLFEKAIEHELDLTIDGTDQSGNTIFNYIIDRGQTYLLDLALQMHHVDLNIVDSKSRTPLQNAITSKNNEKKIPIIQAILKASSGKNVEFDINHSDRNKRNALHLAVVENIPEVVEMLMRMPKLNLDLADMNGRTAFQLALARPDDVSGAMIMATEIVNQKLTMDWNRKDDHGTVFHKALVDERLELFSIMLNGENINLNVETSRFETVLQLSMTEHIDPQFSILILERYQKKRSILDINKPDPRGRTIAHLAVERKRMYVLDMLLHVLEMNWNVLDLNSMTPLMVALQGDKDGPCVSIVEKLIKFHIERPILDINTVNRMNMTALRLAVKQNSFECVKIIMGCKEIDLNIEDNEHRTVLQAALGRKEKGVKIARCIADKAREHKLSVDMSRKDEVGTLYHYCVKYNLFSVLNSLLQLKDIDLDITDDNGQTPLACALKSSCPPEYALAIVTAARENAHRGTIRFDVNFNDQMKQTYAHMAVRNDRLDILNYLLQFDSVNLNSTDAKNRTSLKCAIVEMPHKEELALAILSQRQKNERCLDLNVHDENHDTILHTVVETANENILAGLLSCSGLDINATNKDGLTALEYGVILMRQGEPESSVEVAPAAVTTANFIGDMENDKNLADIFQSSKVLQMSLTQNSVEDDSEENRRIEADQREKKDLEQKEMEEKRYNCLLAFIRICVKSILPLDVNGENLDEGSLLHLAMNLDKVELLRALLDAPNANLTLKDSNNRTILQKALDEPFEPQYAILIIEKARIKSPQQFNPNLQDVSRRSYAHMCVETGRLDALKLLVTCPKVDIGMANDHMITPLMEAINLHPNDPRYVTCMLEKYKTDMSVMNIDSVDSQGRHALHYAVKQNSREIVELLLNTRGIEVNSTEQLGMTPIMYAINDYNQSGRCIVATAMLKKIIQMKHVMDPNLQERKGETVLHMAVRLRHLVIIRLLLDIPSINLNIEDNMGYTAVDRSMYLDEMLKHTEKNNPDAVKTQNSDFASVVTILDVARKRELMFDPNRNARPGDKGRTLLHHAVEKNRPDMVDVLLDIHSIDVDICDSQHRTALITAVCMFQPGQNECAINILTKVADKRLPLDVSVVDEFGRSALHHAVDANHTHLVDMLLPYLSLKSVRWQSAAYSACRHDDAHCFKVIFEGAIQEDCVLRFSTKQLRRILLFATRKSLYDILQHVLRFYQDPIEEQSLRMALNTASRLSYLDCYILLLQRLLVQGVIVREGIFFVVQLDVSETLQAFIANRDFDGNLKKENGLALLHIAAQYNSVACARLLIQSGADMHISDAEGNKPLHYATNKESFGVAKYLIESHASVNSVNNANRSVLHNAVENDNMELVLMMCRQGVDLHIKDNTGANPVLEARGEMQRFMLAEMAARRAPVTVFIEHCNMCEIHHGTYSRHSSQPYYHHVDQVTEHIKDIFPSVEVRAVPIISEFTGTRIRKDVLIGAFEVIWSDSATSRKVIFSKIASQKFPSMAQITRDIFQHMVDHPVTIPSINQQLFLSRSFKMERRRSLTEIPYVEFNKTSPSAKKTVAISILTGQADKTGADQDSPDKEKLFKKRSGKLKKRTSNLTNASVTYVEELSERESVASSRKRPASAGDRPPAALPNIGNSGSANRLSRIPSMATSATSLNSTNH